jgi:hypothetical protein
MVSPSSRATCVIALITPLGASGSPGIPGGEHFPAQEAGATEPAPQTPELVAPQDDAAPAPAPDDLATLFEGALLDAANGQDFAETPGYRKLLQHVDGWPDADFDARSFEHLDHAQASADPAAWQGRLVSLRGILVDLRAVRLERPIWDEVDAYRAIVTEADGSEGVICDMLGPPPDLDLDELDLRRDVVDVQGVFYRTVSYENQDGEPKLAPYLIAKRIRIPRLGDSERETSMDAWPLVVIGSALAYGLFRGALVVRDRRKRRREIGAGGSAIRKHLEAPSGKSAGPTQRK